LRKPEVFKHLPLTIGVLIDLAAWPRDQVGNAIAQGILHPHAERNQLKKWRRNQGYVNGPTKLPPPDTRVVGYIMCDVKTYTIERAMELWEKFDEMQQHSLPDDMHITPYADDAYFLHREQQLGQRVWDAYAKHPGLFVDARFRRVVEDKDLHGGSLSYYLNKLAPIIASGDHRELHRIIKFSPSDWKLFGVTNVGYASLLSYINDVDGRPLLDKHAA